MQERCFITITITIMMMIVISIGGFVQGGCSFVDKPNRLRLTPPTTVCRGRIASSTEGSFFQEVFDATPKRNFRSRTEIFGFSDGGAIFWG